MFNWTLDKWINKATNEEKKLEKMLCIKYRLCWCRTKISSLNKVQTKNRRSGHRYILSNIQISLVDFLQNRPFKTLGCERTTTATTTTTAAIWKQREKKNSRKLKTNRKEKQEISSPKRRRKKKHFWNGCDTQTYTHTGYNHISRAVVKGE